MKANSQEYVHFANFKFIVKYKSFPWQFGMSILWLITEVMQHEPG